MARQVVDAYGRIDVLVNNAAIFSTIKMRPFWELSVAEWDELMAVNVRGVWLAAKAVVPQMRKQRSGRIVNISSGVVLMGRPNYLHYVASKGAVMSMTRAMAKELGEFGINVNCITPGPVYTEVPRATVTPQQREAMIAAQSIKRAAGTQDLEGTVVFLCSDDASFITGQTINVDGGMNFH
jgi:3-oxoacyl-[acyl-carrier protein] reductase